MANSQSIATIFDDILNGSLFRFNFEPSELNNELFVQGTSIEQQLSEGEEKEEVE